MAITRDDPYGAFNYKVTIIPNTGETISAAFSEVSGMNTETTFAEYRDGTDASNRVRKVALTYKVGDITLKRGMAGNLDLYRWVDAVRKGNMEAKASMVLEMRAENGATVVATYKLTGVRPQKITMPTFAAKGATEVAMEELVVVAEDITLE